MADSGEILKEIAVMEGRTVDDDESTIVNEEAVDEQDQEGQEGQEEQASGETEEGREVLESDEEEESLEDRYARLLSFVNEQSAQLNALRDAGYNVSTTIGQPQTSPPTPVEMPTQPQVTPPPAAIWQLDESLLNRALIEDDPQALKEILVGLYQTIQRERVAQREEILLDLPRVAQSVTRQQMTIMRAVDQFYQENPDLLAHSHIVGNAANRIVAQEPNLSMKEAFDKAEKEARKVLGLKKRVQQIDAEEGRGKPVFAKAKASRKPGAPVLSGVKGEIGRMQEAKW